MLSSRWTLTVCSNKCLQTENLPQSILERYFSLRPEGQIRCLNSSWENHLLTFSVIGWSRPDPQRRCLALQRNGNGLGPSENSQQFPDQGILPLMLKFENPLVSMQFNSNRKTIWSFWVLRKLKKAFFFLHRTLSYVF